MEADDTSTPQEEPLTGEALRAKLKEEHLKELRARKEIQQQAQSQHYLNNALKALEEMSAFSEDTDEWVARLNGQSLLQEAKLDMALGTEQTPANTGTEEEPAPGTAEEASGILPPDKTLGDESR
ncbi:MAG: hypothetical protein KF690_09280 [Bacteroidetes bacterium]|nr:hypothetical protein [Bacteroidota bacterium]